MQTELYFLGAGRPLKGSRPSALKHIADNTKAMDWQLLSFSEVVPINNINFLGGYLMDEVIAAYPNLNFSLVSSWKDSNALETLLQAPFSGSPAIVTYSDTIFRKQFVNKLARQKGDVTIAIDSGWRKRFASRSQEDIENAEVLSVEGHEVEFTGLLYMSSRAVEHLKRIAGNRRINDKVNNMLGLIDYFENTDLTINYLDVESDWAEFNSGSDIANFIFGSKADTLARLENIVKKSLIGKQISFTISEWKKNKEKILQNIKKKFGNISLVVRSSSKHEDSWHSSNAGRFRSILGISSTNDIKIKKAVNEVISSYGKNSSDNDQVFLQEFLEDITIAGVVFTCSLESGAPYYRFNFDDLSQSTDSVTSGINLDFRTVIINKSNTKNLSKIAPELSPVLEAIKELEVVLGFDKLDIEFALDRDSKVHIFQVRPIVVNHEEFDIDHKKLSKSIAGDFNYFKKIQPSSESILGDKAFYSNMSDWNPAEIIGTRPKPFSLSLYRYLITDEVWAQQRHEYGYRDLRSHNLITSFSGQPYVDVRASFNSFIPKNLSKASAKRVINAYLSLLEEKPHLHDKIEFDIAFTVWTPEFNKAATARLRPYGVRQSDINQMEDGLKKITRDSLVRLTDDTKTVHELGALCNQIEYSDLTNLEKILLLINECKQHGTLAFSHAARAGFVATSFLKSLVKNGILSERRQMEFLNSFDTVAGELKRDKSRLNQNKITKKFLIEKYGHLRSGTYEVTTPAYWEDPNKYLINSKQILDHQTKSLISLTDEEKEGVNKMIEKLGVDISTENFIKFLCSAIKERERVKFEFTRNLSMALDFSVKFGEEMGLSRNQVSFLSYQDLLLLKQGLISDKELLENNQTRQEDYKLTKIIELPSLITSPEQFYGFEIHPSEPNFIGLDDVIAEITEVDEKHDGDLTNKIIFITQADPGFDWLFDYKIAGLVTLYGGANSHMAIRAAEIGLPAAIGIGEKLYNSLRSSERIHLDCLGKALRVVE